MNGYAPWQPGVSVWLAGLGLAAVTSVIVVACTLDNRATGPDGAGGATTGVGLGGDEGGYNTGGGGRGAGGAELEELESWKADAQRPVDGAYRLPSWLVLESPSENKTVQVGLHELKTGIGANVARARNVGNGWGLTLEGERRNRVFHSRITTANWRLIPSDTTTLEQIPGPDGANNAARLGDNSSSAYSGASSPVEAVTEEVDATLSVWLSGVASGEKAYIAASGLENRGRDVSAGEWTRESVTRKESVVANPLVQLYPAHGDAMLTGSASFAFVSLETGKYPSSVIVTETGPLTRRAESLSVSNARARALIPDGRFHVRLVFAPHYASGEQEADHDLFFVDATHRVYLSAETNQVVVAEGEAEASTGALSWDREEPITVEIVRTAAALAVRVPGAAPEESAQVPAAAFEIPGDIHILGDATGCQEGADLKSITFFKPE